MDPITTIGFAVAFMFMFLWCMALTRRVSSLEDSLENFNSFAVSIADSLAAHERKEAGK